MLEKGMTIMTFPILNEVVGSSYFAKLQGSRRRMPDPRIKRVPYQLQWGMFFGDTPSLRC